MSDEIPLTELEQFSVITKALREYIELLEDPKAKKLDKKETKGLLLELCSICEFIINKMVLAQYGGLKNDGKSGFGTMFA